MANCPLCEGSKRIVYADIRTFYPSRERKVDWQTGREIACGCIQLVPIKGRTA